MNPDTKQWLGASNRFAPAYVEQACQWLQYSAEVIAVLRDEALRLSQDETLTALADQACEALCQDRDVRTWNETILAVDQGRGLFAAVVYLARLPHLYASYRERGLSEQLLIDTLDDMERWMQHEHRTTGRWGCVQWGWLHRHWSGQLFRFGRLQAAPKRVDLPVSVLRHRYQHTAYAVIMEQGVQVRTDGRIDGTNGRFDPDAWTTVWEADTTSYNGHLVTPSGAVSAERTQLSADEWDIVMQRGDLVWDIHIPEGDKLSPEACCASYQRAMQFAADHMDESVRGMVCSSWLLSPQWMQLLPATSNIVQFQQPYLLIPERSNEEQTLQRVFGFGTTLQHLPSLPKETSLQRIVHDYLTQGGCIHGGAGFIPAARAAALQAACGTNAD